jgi:hypothetical protein
MKKNRQTGGALVCPDALVRKQLRTWFPSRKDARWGDDEPICIQVRQVFSLLEQTTGTKNEA